MCGSLSKEKIEHVLRNLASKSKKPKKMCESFPDSEVRQRVDNTQRTTCCVCFVYLGSVRFLTHLNTFEILTL
jgi:hypothetical protein